MEEPLASTERRDRVKLIEGEIGTSPTNNSPPKSIHDLLHSSQKKFRPGTVKTFKNFMIKPRVIYLKSKRDQAIIIGEKLTQ